MKAISFVWSVRPYFLSFIHLEGRRSAFLVDLVGPSAGQCDEIDTIFGHLEQEKYVQ